ncbi:MAG: GTPase domain-containing protein [Nocardioides sp.]
MSNPVGRRLGKSGAAAAVGTTLATTALAALANAPERFARLFHKRYPLIAVTGMTGVGKTALANRLSRTSGAETAEVGSATMEHRTRRNTRMRGFRIRVVPGENAATRLGALDDVFHDEPVDGVLHVVSYGHATPRRTGGTTGSATATREQQLATELEDWSITAHRIASLAIRRKEPTWLIIAVTKTDLFPGQVDEAVRYYSPGSGSPFGDKLDELRALAGAAKLSIDVLPVCSQSTDRKTSRQCTALMSALESRMEQLSGHGV